MLLFLLFKKIYIQRLETHTRSLNADEDVEKKHAHPDNYRDWIDIHI